MATNQEFVAALRRAAEHFAKRNLSQAEVDRLVVLFNEAKGTNHQRALEALERFCGVTEAQITKRAASDDTDRIIQDLKDTIDQWKPGT